MPMTARLGQPPFAVAALVAAIAAVPAGAAAADWAAAKQVTVVTTDYRFQPKHLKLRAGSAYRLRLENRGKEMHEFNAAALFAAAEIGNPEALNADRTEIQVHPGEAKELLFVPQAAGKYRLICPDHDWTGMVGDITVR